MKYYIDTRKIANILLDYFPDSELTDLRYGTVSRTVYNIIENQIRARIAIQCFPEASDTELQRFAKAVKQSVIDPIMKEFCETLIELAKKRGLCVIK